MSPFPGIKAGKRGSDQTRVVSANFLLDLYNIKYCLCVVDLAVPRTYDPGMKAHFGQVFKDLRIEADLTQEELGGKIKLSRQKVGALERGESPMTAENFIKLCLGLEIDLETPLAMANREFLEEMRTLLPELRRDLGLEAQPSEEQPSPTTRRELEIPSHATKWTVYLVKADHDPLPNPLPAQVPPSRGERRPAKKRARRSRRNNNKK